MKSLGIAVLAVSCGACASTWYPHRFVPAPLEVRLGVDGDPSAQARALITVLGIRRPDDESGTGARIEVRFRIENLGATPVRLDPGSVSLVAADLEEIGPAQVSPDPGPLEAGASAVYDIVFPMGAATPEDHDLQGLNLKWTVEFGDQRVTTGVTFERLVYPGHGHPEVRFGFGYYTSG